MSKAEGLLGSGVIKEVACDKAYDSESFIRSLVDRGLSPVIPVRDVPKALKEQSSLDREVPLSVGDNITYDKYSGEVFCYSFTDPSKPVRRQMIYGGCERERQSHKFRCPAATTWRWNERRARPPGADLVGHRYPQVRTHLPEEQALEASLPRPDCSGAGLLDPQGSLPAGRALRSRTCCHFSESSALRYHAECLHPKSAGDRPAGG